jgi:predicted transcriptional regulator
MTILDLISHTTPPLKSTDTVEHVLGLLMEFRVRHLPVVDDEGLLVGIISEEQLLDASGPGAALSSLVGAKPISARPDAHVFDVTKIMVDHNLTALPIANENGYYMGLVRRHDIFEQFARMLSTHETGAILALEVAPRDHSLSRLIYIIEQNEVKVLSVATEPADADSGKIRITLKLDVKDTARVRSRIEHEGYRVVAAFSDEDQDEELQFRIQEFMRYLEV